jgi:hypothetical protein
MTLIKEDGTGQVDANSYADVTDGDAYHEGHLYAAAWTGATVDDKAKALVMATRLIDSQCRFNGFRAHSSQALQWPREQCPDPDRGNATLAILSAGFLSTGNWVESNVVPKAVADAACEMARELLIVDRTAAPAGEGIDYLWNATTRTKYSKADTRPIISHVAQAMLAKFGAVLDARTETIKLIRS